MKKKQKCCYCGRNFVGEGNNPWGILDIHGKPIAFPDDAVCCDECNAYAITGRIYLITKGGEADD